jgi:hypothetical protein
MRKSVKEILETWTVNLNTENTEHRDWILEATDDELDEYILGQIRNPSFREMALAERGKRHFKHLSKPHWTTTPNFWLTVVAVIVAFLSMIFAAIAAWPVIREWIQSSVNK